MYNMKQQPAIGVPVGQPPQTYQGHPQTLGHPPVHGQWTTGLCDCSDDVHNCCITCWCPCITFGQSAEIIDKGSSSCGASGALYVLIAVVTGCPFLYSCTYRSKLKQQYGMPQSCIEDCCIHYLCHGCALCQEYRELQHRGYNVSLGWQGNMERLNKEMGIVNPPNVPGGMNR